MRSGARAVMGIGAASVLVWPVVASLLAAGGVARSAPTASSDALGPWTSIGPSPLAYSSAPANPANFNSGRIAALAVDPADATHWLAGVGNGGVWETRTAGASWTPISDAAPTLAIGAVTFAPSDPRIVYAGTGEAAGVGFTHAGVGMLKSSDSGATWTLLGQSEFARGAIHRIRVHPADPAVLMAISSRAGAGRDAPEHLSAPPPFGVWKSVNGGTSWSRTLAGQATALEIDATNFANQYAALGDQRVGVLSDTPGASPNGVYRSTDGGTTWAAVAGPWGANPTALGRIELALAPSNPNVLYASIQIGPNGGSSGTGLLGLYRTDNAWAATPSWVQVPFAPTGSGGYCGPGKCGYAHAISVAPVDANILFAGGAEQGFWRCTNCNTAPQWTNVTASAPVHPDVHALAWAGTRLIVGNDGGVWSTTDGGGTWANHNRSLVTGMFYSGALHPTDATAIVAGLRDFSISVLAAGAGWQILPIRANAEWGEAEVAISTSRPNTDWMGAWISGRVYRTRDGGATIADAMGGLDRTGAAFVAPVRQCPANEQVFVTGTNRLWRTDTFFSAAAVTWTANSPAHPYPFPNSLDAPGTVLAIAFAPSDPTCQTYAYGNRGGELYLTRNGGATWTNLDPGTSALPSRPVNSLAFDPATAATLYAAFSGFDIGTPSRPGHIFRTTTATSNTPAWAHVGPADDTPFNVLRIDPRNVQVIYAGSDTGLFVTTDGAATWTRIGLAQGLPPATIHDVQINPALNRTVVFTYGRGAYQLTPALGAPGGLSASVAGNAVTLQWTAASGGPTSYALRAGSAPGLSDLADVDTGSTATSVSGPVPNGTYFVRVHGRNASGIGPASNEVRLDVGPVPCTQPPPAPASFSASAAGLAVTLGWQPSAGATGYLLEAGSATGQADLAIVNLGNVSSLQANAVPGTFFLRVRAVNACGMGPASNEVLLQVGTSLPGAPVNASSSVNGRTVTIAWSPPTSGGAASAYRLEAGSATGLTDLGTATVTGSPLVVPNVPGGIYFVRVRAVNAAGAGPASPDLTIVVP